MQDLHVTEILPQMITLTEAYIQVLDFFQKHISQSVKNFCFLPTDLGTVYRKD